MSATVREPRIAIHCTPTGTIEHVIHNDFSQLGEATLNQPFYRILDSNSLMKAARFIQEIQQEGACLGWEMNLCLGDTIKMLHFSGAELGDKYVIVGAATRTASINLFDELIKINNEHVNSLRRQYKFQEIITRSINNSETVSYDDFTQLNSDHASMQRDLIKKNVELKSLNEQKNQLLGMAAHDLRNPLGVIMNFSKFLARELGVQLDAKQSMFLQKIQQSSESMLHLIDDLLNYSKIESGQLSLNLSTFCLEELIQATVDLNSPIAEQKSIRIEVEKKYDECWIEADRHKLEQVFNNLISNAIKFSHPHTAIRVTIEQDDECSCLSVADTGLGIPPEKQQAIFHPFHNQGQQGTAGEKSTGLGLAICQRIVKGHNGAIEVQSEPGQGSVFTVRLPKCHLAPYETAQEAGAH